MRGIFKSRTLSVFLFLFLFTAAPSCSENKDPPLKPAQKIDLSDGLGTAYITPAEDVNAGSLHTWKINYIASEKGIATGGGIVFHISPFWGWTPPQNRSPQQPGFINIICSNSIIKPDIEVNSRNNYVMVRFNDQPLKYGEQITLVYGDTQGKFNNAKSHSDIYAENDERFYIKVDGDGDGFFTPIKIHPKINILARPGKRLNVTAPSYIEPGKAFTVTTAALDSSDNWDKTFKQIIHLTSFPEGIFCDEIPAENNERLFQCITEKEGSYFLSAKNNNGSINGESNPIISTKIPPPLNLYWGDLHGHSNLSDGTGTPDNYFNYARFAAGLDVAALTDHDGWGFDRLDEYPKIWSFIKERANAHHKSGKFVTFTGYEYTNWTSGHMHVIFNEDPAPLFSYRDPAYSTPDKLWKALKGHTAITIPHHTGGGPIATDWNYYSSEFMPVVEICSIHGNSESIDAPLCIYRPKQGSFVRDALARGYNLGIIASGDTHNGHPGMGDPSAPTGGLIAFYARELTRDAIWDALKKRRVYGTSGKRIILDFKINDHPMGEIIKLNKQAPKQIEIKVTGTDRLKLVEIIKNNKSLKKYSWTEPSFSVSFTDNSITSPRDYYYLRVEQQDNHMAWSSPIYITSVNSY
jgi:hypothetical protein